METPADNANHESGNASSVLVVPRIEIRLIQDNLTGKMEITMIPAGCLTNAQMAGVLAEVASKYAGFAVKFESDLITKMQNMDRLLKKQNGGG